MKCAPAPRVERVREAWPWLSRGTVPRALLRSRKVTVPVDTGPDELILATEAEKVMGCPATVVRTSGDDDLADTMTLFWFPTANRTASLME
jgi:hypothetical protein